VQSRLLLNIVVSQGTAILQLLTGKNKALLVRWDTLLVLNLGFHVVDSIGGLHLESDSLTGKSLDENLHTSAKTKHQVQSRLLLNIVVSQGTAILQLLTGKNKALLVRWDTLLVLNLGFHVVDSIGGLHLESDSLSGKSLDEDLHTSTETKN